MMKKLGIDLLRQIPMKKTLENDKYRLKLLVGHNHASDYDFANIQTN